MSDEYCKHDVLVYSSRTEASRCYECEPLKKTELRALLRIKKRAKTLLDLLEEAQQSAWRIHQECGDKDCRVCPPRLELKAKIETAMTELAEWLDD